MGECCRPGFLKGWPDRHLYPCALGWDGEDVCGITQFLPSLPALLKVILYTKGHIRGTMKSIQGTGIVF